MRLLAHIISAVFQPLLMPTLVFYTVLYHVDNSTNLTDSGMSSVMTLIFLTTCLIPVMIILLFRLVGVVKDLQMRDKRDRRFPFLFVSIFYIVVTYLFAQQPILDRTPVLIVSLTAITVVVLLTNLITFFWKISAHAAGVVGWLGFVVVLAERYPGNNTLVWPLVAAIALSGIVIWARLYLNAHRPKETLAGSVLGFLICYGSIYFFLT